MRHEAWAAEPPAVAISGAEGPNAGIANGRYELAERGVYRKVGVADNWLYIATTGCWWVSNTESKDARKASGFVYSVAGADGLPPASGEAERQVYDGKKWAEQALQLRALNAEEAAAENVGPRAAAEAAAAAEQWPEAVAGYTAALLLDPQNQELTDALNSIVEKPRERLFMRFANADGVVGSDEFKAYLRAIKMWGTEWYTDKKMG